MKKAILLIPLALAIVANVHAQSIGPSIINAAGGTAVIGSNEFDWSVGEMTLVSTFTSPGIIVTQGVLQPAPGPSGITNNSILAQQLQVFPNPAVSIVNVKYSSQGNGTLTCKLFDITGKVISIQTINVTQGVTVEKVNVTGLACADYLLEVTVNPNNTEPQSISYKIQKLK